MAGYAFYLIASNFANIEFSRFTEHITKGSVWRQINHPKCQVEVSHIKCLVKAVIYSYNNLQCFLVPRTVNLCLRNCFLLTLELHFRSGYIVQDRIKLFSKRCRKVFSSFVVRQGVLTQTYFFQNRYNYTIVLPSRWPKWACVWTTSFTEILVWTGLSKMQYYIHFY